MITASTEFYRNLYRIQQDHNLPSLALLLPSEENIYELDLNSRTIDAPEFLGTTAEHAAEVIYFKCNRFFDYMDLTTCACVIQFENAKGENGMYIVPFVDVATYSMEDKMLIPWLIDGNVTAEAGEVTFSIRFYKIDINGEKMLYNLQTLATKSKVLESVGIDIENKPDFVFTPSQYEQIVFNIAQIMERNDLEWIVLN